MYCLINEIVQSQISHGAGLARRRLIYKGVWIISIPMKYAIKKSVHVFSTRPEGPSKQCFSSCIGFLMNTNYQHFYLTNYIY